jgi:hypothetical protein
MTRPRALQKSCDALASILIATISCHDDMHLLEQLLQHLQHESTVYRLLRALLRQ